VVRVCDSGIGIPPQLLSRVFDLFRQVDEAGPRARPGLGVGLAIVRSLVELHGGKIVAKSRGVGSGSEFTVSLPGAG
jgi:signal transduction histidine kinase